MNRLASLLSLTCRINDAMAVCDWTALASVDSALTATLPAMAEQGAWTVAERRALDNLRIAHQEGHECCTRELELLRVQLQEMRANKDGWLAYAQHSDLEESRT